MKIVNKNMILKMLNIYNWHRKKQNKIITNQYDHTMWTRGVVYPSRIYLFCIIKKFPQERKNTYFRHWNFDKKSWFAVFLTHFSHVLDSKLNFISSTFWICWKEHLIWQQHLSSKILLKFNCKHYISNEWKIVWDQVFSSDF